MRTGQIIGERYRIIEHIGSGGMATVFLAYDPILERQVAIKFLRIGGNGLDDAKRRFKREAMSIAELDHPNVVNIYDVGEDMDGNYIVMEYVDGVDLKSYIKDHQPFSLREYQEIMLQVLSGMASAHQKGIIHRDLKPQNIMIKPDGTVKIMDFGIALISTETSITQTNTIIGSVHYLSPEQARGSMASPQSDIYSLGIVSFEMLTGQVPFDGESAVSIAIQHFQEDLPPISNYRKDVPQAMQNVIRRATAKDPEDRYQTCEEMAKALSTSLDPSRAYEAPYVVPSVSGGETRVMDKASLEKSLASTPRSFQPVKEDSKDLAQTSVRKNPPQTHAKADKPKDKGKPHKKFLMPKKIIAAIVFLTVCLILLLSWTRGKNIRVPDVTNYSEVNAKLTLEARGLKVGEKKQEYSRKIAKGNVIRTDPGKGRRVKGGETIDLFISQGEEPVEVEDYTGKDVDQAEKSAKEKGFKVEISEELSDRLDKGKIIEQTPAPGKKVLPSETTLHFKVSKGKKLYTMPDFKGLDRKGVEKYAQTVGLNVEFSEEYSDHIGKGLVIDQSLAPGSSFTRGTKIKVTLSKGDEGQSRRFKHTFTIPYSGNGESDSIEVYVDDLNHNYDTPIDTLKINNDTAYTLHFETKANKSARFKVMRNGRVIMEKRVTASEE